MFQYIVCQMQYAKNNRMSYCIHVGLGLGIELELKAQHVGKSMF